MDMKGRLENIEVSVLIEFLLARKEMLHAQVATPDTEICMGKDRWLGAFDHSARVPWKQMASSPDLCLI